jgi:hypothetical protein
MSGCLSIIRWFLAFILSLIFIILISLAVVGSTISILVSNPATIKTWATDLGLYDNVLGVAVIGMREASKESPYFADLLARYETPNSELKRIAEGILEPTLLKTNVETVVDATYAWLDGRTARPEFEVAIVRDEQLFVDALTLGFAERILGLPECDSTFVMPEEFNPFAAECRPVSYGAEQVNAYISESKSDPRFNELFQRSVLDSDLIVIDQQTSNYAQLGYKVVQFFPLMALLILFLVGLLLWWIIPGKRRAIVIIGLLFTLPGAVLGILAFIASSLYSRLFTLLLSVMNGATKLILLYLQGEIDTVYQSIIGSFGLVSLICVLIGVALIAAVFLRRKQVIERNIRQKSG